MHLCSRILQRHAVEQDWEDIDIPSKSEAGLVYVVAYAPWGKQDAVCDCIGYLHRDTCSHVQRAHKIVNCEWTSNDNQTPTLEGLCPRCGSALVEVRHRK